MRRRRQTHSGSKGARAGYCSLGMRRGTLAGIALVVAQTVACGFPERRATLPSTEHAWIAVLSGEMPDAIEQVARHAWIVASVPGNGSYHRWEYLGGASRSETRQPFEYFGSPTGDVAIHGTMEGSSVQIAEMMRCLDTEATPTTSGTPPTFRSPAPTATRSSRKRSAGAGSMSSSPRPPSGATTAVWSARVSPSRVPACSSSHGC